MTHTHHSHTPEQNLAARMAHVARMSALVEDITEEGTQGPRRTAGPCGEPEEGSDRGLRCREADTIRMGKAYLHHARVMPLPEDGPVYQKETDSTHMALSDNGEDTRTVHPSWEDRLPEMEDGFRPGPFERLPLAGPAGFYGTVAKAWGYVKGLFA
ncbi:hypothetical protein CJ97_gp19 [Ralstonia phage RSB2]|uniref:Uncharacterized protein ORF19 n=1 Tax=Ralstonia phage RSB2 TaxID=913183 RepID=E5RUZ9_9CAUD|nr:hypothetical protein CJ97_gp19 [Ralstonia phage RSB2]BAJ51807.1 hypothetical protein [Ralstonia phage RSB2]